VSREQTVIDRVNIGATQDRSSSFLADATTRFQMVRPTEGILSRVADD